MDTQSNPCQKAELTKTMFQGQSKIRIILVFSRNFYCGFRQRHGLSRLSEFSDDRSYHTVNFVCLNTRRPVRYHDVRYVGLTSHDDPLLPVVDAAAVKKMDLQQQLNEEKRFLLQKKKDSKRSERIERQKSREASKATDPARREDARYKISTKPGEKKDTLCSLPDAYSPQFVEAAWYDWWEKQGFFTPEYSCSDTNSLANHGKSFVMCLPPPNVTGSLHLGHALGGSIQDAIARWHRMCGRSVLWNPGSDHAGIATQVVVEKKLWLEKRQTRHDIGREKFLEEVWKWKHEKGDRIYFQLKKLGLSLDWTRERFTLDEKMSRAVNEAFIHLYDDGVIYRSKRLVNWSCSLSSAISDVEVENLSLEGKCFLDIPGYEKKIAFGCISSFSYSIEGSDETVAVATTRLETMLGDTAIAVHPLDVRFSHLHGRFARHPICERLIPIVCDDIVNPNFGTGAVKVTPAHDRNDFEIGLRHKLEMKSIIDENGRMINVPEKFKGLKRFDAREMIEEELKKLGLYNGTSDHTMVLPVCSRSKDVVEFLLKDQWFVNCKEMANKAIQAVENGSLKLIPNHYEKQWKDWLLNTRDWCISRQLWWGHRIPAYKIIRKQMTLKEAGAGENELWIAAHCMSEAKEKASFLHNIPSNELVLEQDEDVLDTWFSSALFPFSIFGWPEKTTDLSRFYPTHLLETASDIMFFWVARMIMLGQALTNQLPFSEVLFHSVLRDAHGRKMSKSLGNIIDPMDVIKGTSVENLFNAVEKSNLNRDEMKKTKSGIQRDFPLGIPECGSDALRFSLCSYKYTDHFVNIDINHVKMSRHFCNKIWQSYRFIASHLGHDFQPNDFEQSSRVDDFGATDRWILSRLSDSVKVCNESFSSYNLMDATKMIYRFWWSDFCDVYLEYSKAVVQTGSPSDVANVKEILYTCLETGLRLLSPFMPFVTEELYQRLPRRLNEHIHPPSIMVAPYPLTSQYKFYDRDIEEKMKIVRDLINRLLSLRRDVGLNKTKATVYISSSDVDVRRAFNDYYIVLLNLSRSKEVILLAEADVLLAPSSECISISNETADWTAHMQLKGLIKKDEELNRLHRQKLNLEEELKKLESKTKNMKTPDEEIMINHEKIKIVLSALARTENVVKSIEKLRLNGD